MWATCRSHRSGDNLRAASYLSFLVLLTLLVNTLAAQPTDSIVWYANTQLGDTLCAFPLSQRTYSLGTRPILASSLRIVRSTLPAGITPTLLLDSTATQLSIVVDAETVHDTLWLQYRYLNRPTNQEFSVYALLDSVSPSDLPRWKQIQQEHSISQKTSTSPPFILYQPYCIPTNTYFASDARPLALGA